MRIERRSAVSAEIQYESTEVSGGLI